MNKETIKQLADEYKELRSQIPVEYASGNGNLLKYENTSLEWAYTEIISSLSRYLSTHVSRFDEEKLISHLEKLVSKGKPEIKQVYEDAIIRVKAL